MKLIAPADMTILEALAVLSPQSSKNTLRDWIKEGRVFINGQPAKNTSVKVLKEQEVSIGQKKKAVRPGLPIIYEDSDLVIVNKPIGLLSVAAAFEKGETLHALLKKHYHPRQVFVVHRLDQDTSGVMAFALSQKMCDKMKELFEVHAIERAYSAIVEGEMKTQTGTWKSYLFEDGQYFVHETEDEAKGKLAITHYQTLGANKRFSWLELRLETGRKNQIRVHCQAAGHPVSGDRKYGGHSSPIKRLCLHAHLLAYKHPLTGKTLRFEAPPPEEFYRLVPGARSHLFKEN